MRLHKIPFSLWRYWWQQKVKLAKARLDRARGVPRLRRKFLRNHGYPLNLEAPQTFSEKIQWRKLHDTNPLLPILSNKYLVRDHIARVLGQTQADALLVPLLHYTEDPDSLDLAALPDQFVLKATHGSGLNLIVTDKSTLDPEATRLLMHRWLLTDYGVDKHEWVYSRTRRGIMVEQLVAPPEQLFDVKLYYFDGKLHCCVVVEHLGQDVFQTYFDSTAQRLEARRLDRPTNPDATLPDTLDEITAIAAPLGRGLDFVRVDFMYAPDRFYLGELSLLPGSGLHPIAPASFARELGENWVLPMSAGTASPTN